MENDSVFIVSIYEIMKEAGLASSSAEFSVNVLGGDQRRLNSFALGERSVSYELLDHLTRVIFAANQEEWIEIEERKRQLSALFCHQKCRSEVLAAIEEFRQRSIDKDMDDLLDGDVADDALLNALLANAGLERVG